MNELVLPVPKTVSATYIVPVPTPMNTVEARQASPGPSRTRRPLPDTTRPVPAMNQWRQTRPPQLGMRTKSGYSRHPGDRGSCSLGCPQVGPRIADLRGA